MYEARTRWLATPDLAAWAHNRSTHRVDALRN